MGQLPVFPASTRLRCIFFVGRHASQYQCQYCHKTYGAPTLHFHSSRLLPTSYPQKRVARARACCVLVLVCIRCRADAEAEAAVPVVVVVGVLVV